MASPTYYEVNNWIYWFERLNALNVAYTDSIYELNSEELEKLVKELEKENHAIDALDKIKD